MKDSCPKTRGKTKPFLGFESAETVSSLRTLDNLHVHLYWLGFISKNKRWSRLVHEVQ